MELTLALRDLVRRSASLRPADRRTAERILARPTSKPSKCYDEACYDRDATPHYRDGAHVRIHWVEKSGPGADPANGVPTEDDGPGGAFPGTLPGVPDYVEATLEILDQVAQTYLDAGYRPVKPDPKKTGFRGGNALPDIYLGDIADPGRALYGYCTSDDPSVGGSRHPRTWGYCVLDNDYSPQEFGDRHTPLENLQVTAAHEFFHAVQFAYDFFADSWMMEGTATWVEDEIFDSINDNVMYLRSSPLAQPQISLDTYSVRRTFHYGTWIFFRYLTERFPTLQGTLPAIMREMWASMAHDNSPGAESYYSLQAINAALAARGKALPGFFTAFVLANRQPALTYSEAVANNYPSAPIWRTLTLGKQRRKAEASVQLDHLSARHLRVRRASSLSGAWRLRLRFDMSRRASRPRAVVVIKRADGTLKTRKVPLAGDGTGKVVVDFSATKTKWVEVALINASTSYRCNRGASAQTCAGYPTYDDKHQIVRAALVR